MATTRFRASPLEVIEATAGTEVATAFSVLGDETRLAILVALWEAHEPSANETGLSFTELRDRVGVRQGGRFNYHLDRLVGQFVDRTDGGYVLRPVGRKLLETIIGGMTKERSLHPVEIDIPCHRCGGPTAVAYFEDGELYHVCLSCEGNFAWGENACGSVHMFEDRAVEGSPLSAVEFAPAGLDDRSPEGLFAAGQLALRGHHFMKAGGVCDECYGEMRSSFRICEDHDGTDGRCSTCGSRNAIAIRFACATCKEEGSSTPATIATYHPAVLSFLNEHGIDLGIGMRDFETLRENERLLREHISITETVLQTDPPHIEVVLESANGTVSLVMDERLDIVEVDR